MVKIRVKLGAAEVEVESDPEHLREAIDLIPDLVSKLPGSAAVPKQESSIEQQPPSSLVSAADTYQKFSPSDIPVVTIEKSDSLADIISKFFGGAWGREKRKLSDVRSALQSYGLNYPKQSVAVALLRLAKTTKIRRFKAEDGEYVYTSSTAFFTPAVRQQQQEQATEEVAGQLPLPE